MRYQIRKTNKNGILELYDTKIPSRPIPIAKVTPGYYNIRTIELLTQVLNATNITVETGETVELSNEECSYRSESDHAENQLSTPEETSSGNDSPS